MAKETSAHTSDGISVADALNLKRAADRSRPAGLRVCEECGEAAKYTCPGCNMQTCSLPCSKAHKGRTGCTGKRNRTAFVPLDQYGERNMASDFGFLEEAARMMEGTKRHRPVRPKPYQELPPYIKALVGQAHSRGVRLELQQPGMARRMQNSSRWEGGAHRRLCWHLQWRFPAADVTLENRRVPDDKPTSALLEKHLAPAAGAGLARGHRLRRYAEAGADSLTVLMRKPHTPANQPEYWPVDTQQPLCSQLAGRTVTEFPTLLVLLPEEAASGDYPLVPPPVPPPRPPPGPPPTSAASSATAAGAAVAPAAAATHVAGGAPQPSSGAQPAATAPVHAPSTRSVSAALPSSSDRHLAAAAAPASAVPSARRLDSGGQPAAAAGATAAAPDSAPSAAIAERSTTSEQSAGVGAAYASAASGMPGSHASVNSATQAAAGPNPGLCSVAATSPGRSTGFGNGAQDAAAGADQSSKAAPALADAAQQIAMQQG